MIEVQVLGLYKSKKRIALSVTVTLMLIVFSQGMGEVPAARAHESRDVSGGKYQFRVGFLNEPAYQGLDNAVFLAICTGSCVTRQDGSGTFSNGVTGAFETLKVEITFGGQSMVLPVVVVLKTLLLRR